MAVGLELLTQRRLALDLAPRLGKGQEEALVAGQAVLDGVRLAVQRQLVGVVSRRQAGDVGDVFRQHLLAVDASVRERTIGVILLDQLLGRRLEVGSIVRRPPVAQAAARVELRTLVVEAVADLVADGRADRTVIIGIVRLRIEIGWLQDTGREVERIGQRQVHGIDDLRHHGPLAAVDRAVQLGQVALVVGQFGAADIAVGVAADNIEIGIVDPLVGIADADLQRPKLGQGLLLGRRRHPGQVGNARMIGGQQVVDDGVDLGLGLGREILFRIELADDFTERIVGRRDGTLPARRLLGRTRHGRAVEGEMLVTESLGQDASIAVDGMESQIGLPGIDRLRRHQGRQPRDRARLPDDEVLLVGQARRLEIGVPVEARRLGGEVGAHPGIIGLVHVFAVDAAGVGLGHLRFQRHDGRRLRLGIGDAGQRQHVRNVRLVLGAQVGHLGRRVEIIVAIGQAQSALQQVGHVVVGVFEALGDPYAENMVGIEVGGVERIDIGPQGGAEIGRQRGLIRHAGNGVELGLERRQALGLDPRLVHVAGIVVADFLRIGTMRRAPLGGILDQVADLAAGLVGQGGIRTEGRAVGRDLRRLYPGAVGVVVEVVARLDRMVDAAQVDIVARRGLGTRRAGDKGKRGCRENGGTKFRHGGALMSLNGADLVSRETESSYKPAILG